MFPLLAQTDDYVVIAKPSGLLVHRTKLAPYDRRFAVQMLRKQLGRPVWPVHRLDRATSGCLLFAINRERISSLQTALTSDHATKRYVALVRGRIPDLGVLTEITTPIKIDKGVFKDAKTLAMAIASSQEPRCSLVVAWPQTGRNHQVRRHLRDLSHPILMDGQHGDTRENKVWRAEWGLTRLGLHCLSMDLPLEEGPLQVTCPVPADLRGVLEQMPWWEEAQERLPELALPPLEGQA